KLKEKHNLYSQLSIIIPHAEKQKKILHDLGILNINMLPLSIIRKIEEDLAERDLNAVRQAEEYGLILSSGLLLEALRCNKIDIIKYLIEEKNFSLKNTHLQEAATF